MLFNEEQSKVIKHIYGPLLCIAGPGSGKTTSIIQRVINMIENGVNPNSILVVTFTKAAADDMKRCLRENPLQFDSAKGCAQGLYNAIKIIKERML